MMSVKVALVKVIVLVVVTSVYTQSATAAPETPDEFCAQFNGNQCERCINPSESFIMRGVATVPTVCYYCAADETCKPFTESTVFPLYGLPCPHLGYNVGSCALPALVVAILIALFLAIFVVMTCCVTCCCCVWCARRRMRMKIVEEEKYLEEKDNIKQRRSEKRAEKKAKHDEIRRKYDHCFINYDFPNDRKRLP